MSDKLRVDLVWEEDDFKPLEASRTLTDDEANLTIDEDSETIILRIPEGMGLVMRRTIQRRVQSIARSGFQVSAGLRIGAGFPIEDKAPEATLSNTLLQAAHGYIPDASLASRRAAEEQQIEMQATGTEGLVGETTAPSISTTPSAIPTVAPSTPDTAVGIASSDRNLVAVGIFAGSLLESVSELFISKDADNEYSLDFGSGNVIRFKVQDGAILDLSFLGISEGDASIQRALSNIEAYLK